MSKTLSFVLNSKDIHVRRELSKRGWLENRLLDSTAYTLRWSYKEEMDNYRLVEGGKERFYNHIKNNEMTSKSGLNRLFKQLCEAGCRPSRFMPRTYEMSEEEDLAIEYQDTALQSIIKKHVKYLKDKRPKECDIIRRLISRKERRHI